MKKQKRSKEEIELERYELEQRKRARAEKAALKAATKAAKPPKETKSEEQIVKEYAEKVIRGKASRGHTDARFAYTKAANTVNKEMWMDTDFFFSVVFQSEKQKYAFLFAWQDMMRVEIDTGESQIQILNGLKLAAALGIKLTRETSEEYPYGALDLKEFVLDDETI